jgi:hypothetical protein
LDEFSIDAAEDYATDRRWSAMLQLFADLAIQAAELAGFPGLRTPMRAW